MESLVQTLDSYFWSENFWLPENVSWAHFEDDSLGITLPRRSHLWLPFPLAILLFVLRRLWERYVAAPVGRWYNLKETRPRPPIPNSQLEIAFKQYRKVLPDRVSMDALCKQTDLTIRQVERWWRRRRVQDKPSELSRFTETSWRFLFYFGAFWYGAIILYDKSWFWDTKFCWLDYPMHHLNNSIYWYYMVELAFYWSLIISVMIDNKRKDFAEMMLHHAATIVLMVISYSVGIFRLGSLVLVLHDSVDWWLEGAKMAKYLRYQKLCDALFVVFTLMWFITRLVLFPTRILRSALVDTLHLMCPTYFVLNALLCLLQVLHVIWFYMICRIVFSFLKTGQVEKDGRSETDPSESSSEENSNCIKHPSNGTSKHS